MTNNKNRICHITTAHPEKDIRIFYKECVSLAKSNYEVFLLVNGGKNHSDSGINIIGFKKLKNRVLRIFIAPWIAFVKALFIKAKVYHIHDPELLPILPFLRIFGKKVIYDIHENMHVSIEDKKWIPFLFRFIISKLYILIEKFIMLFINELVLAEYSYKKFYPKKSTVVLNFPIDNIKEIKKDFTKSIRFIYVGAIDISRGIEKILTVFNNLYKNGFDIYFDLAGIIFSENVKQYLNDFIIENNLQDRIIYHGYVNIHKVYELLREAHIGFSLLEPRKNYIESFPTKVFDYMLFGIPVIASDFELYKEYIENNNAGICVDYNDIMNIEEKLESLLKNRDKLSFLSKSGSHIAKSKYLWKFEAEKLVKLYNKLTN